MDIKELSIEDYMFILNLRKIDDNDIIFKNMVKHFKLENITYKECNTILDNVGKLLNDYLVEGKFKFKQRFVIDNIEFGFIPNFDKITTGEFIDICSYEGNENNIHRLMSILYRPVFKEGRFFWKKTGTYKIEEYGGTDKYCDIMKRVPCDIYLNSMVFFYNLEKELLRD